MSLQRRTPFITVVGVLVLSVLIGVFLFARKRRAKSPSSAKVIMHSVETSPEDALTYWTADKMRDAKPAPMPVVNEHSQEKRPPHSSRSEQH